MDDDLKYGLAIMLTVVLCIALVVSGVIGFRAVKQTDTRPVTDLSVTISSPPDFMCFMERTDNVYVVSCTKR